MAIGFGRWESRLSKPSQVIAYDLILLSKHLDLVVPHTRIEAEAVYEHERLSGSRDFVIEAGAIHVCETLVYWHWGCSFGGVAEVVSFIAIIA
jgi:hypothetical protein